MLRQSHDGSRFRPFDFPRSVVLHDNPHVSHVSPGGAFHAPFAMAVASAVVVASILLVWLFVITYEI